MKRLTVAAVVFLVLAAVGLYFFNQYWIHRFDELIEKQARIYRLDPALVWSVIYEETYFRPWVVGEAAEIGLMQVTPTVGREWAEQTGLRELSAQMQRDPASILRDPERNIQVGCWYLEKISKDYRDTPGAEARMLAAYNAGPSRAAEWNRTGQGERPLTAEQFIQRIDIPSTRAYVSSILTRYRELKKAEGSRRKAVRKADGGRQTADGSRDSGRLFLSCPPSAFCLLPSSGAQR
ncbi:MAG TPA: lytic transglycosylase domain-containing protein [Pyrinomonadaceae bacterium]|nr:lytic transglycosylase domain-containing protein [Pyrinomonadaceae bacterium]